MDNNYPERQITPDYEEIPKTICQECGEEIPYDTDIYIIDGLKLCEDCAKQYILEEVYNVDDTTYPNCINNEVCPDCGRKNTDLYPLRSTGELLCAYCIWEEEKQNLRKI